MPMIALQQTKSYAGSWRVRFSSSSLENRYVPEGGIVWAKLCISGKDHDQRAVKFHPGN